MGLQRRAEKFLVRVVLDRPRHKSTVTRFLCAERDAKAHQEHVEKRLLVFFVQPKGLRAYLATWPCSALPRAQRDARALGLLSSFAQVLLHLQSFRLLMTLTRPGAASASQTRLA